MKLWSQIILVIYTESTHLGESRIWREIIQKHEELEWKLTIILVID